MTPQEKAKKFAKECFEKCPYDERCYNYCMQMYEWTLKQITERASKWIDNNINYNTDDEVSRTKKEILRKSLLKTIQL